MGNEALSNIIKTTYFTPENAKFHDEGGFLSMTILPGENGEEKKYDRVFLHRMFPFEEPLRYLSVLDGEQKELGIIADLACFGEAEQKILLEELNRKYYVQKILTIDRLKDRYGFTYWDVTTPEGKVSFTLQDTQRNIIKMDEDRILILDVDGNRYEIPSISKLERSGYKKIELYL
ncbi:MAG: DUF1854 domain-containing protein [Clostridia bacterium]